MPNSPNDQSVSITEMEKRVEDWVASREGAEQLSATRESARAAAERVLSDAQIEPEQLRQAITV
jgi:hypothetical protein